jgi:7-cyano-7-deazaguanine synthase in queuosine biosynthesis
MGRGHELLAKVRRLHSSAGTDGVVLFSGGLDSTAIAILARRKGLDLTPVYMSHRGNVGNVTKKEITAAHKLAKKATGNDLVVFKPKAKSLPAWYGNDVRFTGRLPVTKAKKANRNRVFLEVLHDAGMADGLVLVGVFGTDARGLAAGRAKDVSKPGLSAHLKKIGAKGTIKTAEDFGGASRDQGKTDLLKEIGKTSRQAPLLSQTESCLMYFGKPCGNCWSCVERAQAFMRAWGQDKTPYRPASTAGRLRRAG